MGWMNRKELLLYKMIAHWEDSFLCTWRADRHVHKVLWGVPTEQPHLVQVTVWGIRYNSKTFKVLMIGSCVGPVSGKNAFPFSATWQFYSYIPSVCMTVLSESVTTVTSINSAIATIQSVQSCLELVPGAMCDKIFLVSLDCQSE